MNDPRYDQDTGAWLGWLLLATVLAVLVLAWVVVVGV